MPITALPVCTARVRDAYEVRLPGADAHGHSGRATGLPHPRRAGGG